jgi:uncharacterized protein Yka (UPF0111/DUF47 family)
VVRLIPPREDKYFALLADLVGKVHAGAAVFGELLADYEHRVGYADRIKAIEQECDDLAADIVGKLNTSFITPIDREDIYTLTTRCDDVIDEVNGLARRLEFSHAVPLPMSMRRSRPSPRPNWRSPSVVPAHAQARTGSPTQPADPQPGEVGDALPMPSVAVRTTNAIEVIKWVTVYEQLEDAIDRCKHLAELLESIVVKHT